MNAQIYVGLPPKIQFYAANNIKIGEANEIMSCVSATTGISLEAMVGRNRQRDVVEARHIAMGLIYFSNPKITWKQIGLMFNRDHSTAIYAVAQYQDLLQTDKSFIAKVKEVKKLTHL